LKKQVLLSRWIFVGVIEFAQAQRVCYGCSLEQDMSSMLHGVPRATFGGGGGDNLLETRLVAPLLTMKAGATSASKAYFGGQRETLGDMDTIWIIGCFLFIAWLVLVGGKWD
jgi:hypothetical protein